ncbi:MAG TPA: CDP-alcohol phosphatidyltransferase family protein [Acidimicrobiales bacterium]|nr:CDP-alcohol phosphatidyltransferase family protein [Acidimicrobiales bacterium]
MADPRTRREGGDLGAEGVEVLTAGPQGACQRPPAAPWRLRTAANLVTVTRIVATPVLVLVLVRDTPSWAAFCFWSALAFSDAADGWLARRRGPSASGAFLDPLADKLMVLAALVALAELGRFSWAPVALLAGREAAITAYRVTVAKHGVSVPARRVAKAKTLAEFVTVGLVLMPVTWPSRPELGHLAHFGLWAAVALAWASGAQYLLDSWSAARRAVPTGA